MEKMPYQTKTDLAVAQTSVPDFAPAGWQAGMPVLTGSRATLRELRVSDAASLFAMLTVEEVSRFISPPPGTIDGFERFIAWTVRQRTAGAYACFAVTVKHFDTAVGVFQVRELEPGFATAEWGFAIGSPFWGTGVFRDAARLVVDFAFGTLGVHRLEARTAITNGRGNGALSKLGAVREGVLRRSFRKDGEHLDQALWTILDADWHANKDRGGPTVH